MQLPLHLPSWVMKDDLWKIGSIVSFCNTCMNYSLCAVTNIKSWATMNHYKLAVCFLYVIVSDIVKVNVFIINWVLLLFSFKKMRRNVTGLSKCVLR